MVYSITGHVLILLVVFIASIIAAHFDRDAGGYVDNFTTTATFPDKAVHAVCAIGLTLALARLMPPFWAAGGTIVAGALYEFAQGYVSRYDLAADIIGAGIAFGFISITQGVS